MALSIKEWNYNDRWKEGQENAPILTVPQEIFAKFLESFTIEQRVRLTSVCRGFYYYISNQSHIFSKHIFFCPPGENTLAYRLFLLAKQKITPPISRLTLLGVQSAIELQDGRLAIIDELSSRVRIWTKEHSFYLEEWTSETNPSSSLHARKMIQLQDGRLAAIGFEKTACIWDLHTKQVQLRLREHKTAIRDIMQLKNGRLVTIAADSIRIWNPDTGNVIHSLNIDESKDSCCRNHYFKDCIELSDDQLAVLPSDQTIRILDSITAKESLCILLDNHSRIKQLSDGKLVSISYSAVSIWDQTSGVKLFSLLSDNPYSSPLYVHDLLQLQDGRLMIQRERGTFIWDGSGEQPVPFEDSTVFNDRCFLKREILQLHDGRLAALSGENHNVCIWDLDSKSHLFCLKHVSAVCTIMQLKDERLVTITEGQTMRIWDLNQIDLEKLQELSAN